MDGPTGGLISIVWVCSAALHLHRYRVAGEKPAQLLTVASVVES